MSRSILRLWALALMVSFTSCGTSQLEPTTSKFVSETTVHSIYSLKDFDEDLDKYAKLSAVDDLSQNAVERKLLRDRMTRIIMTDITAYYGAFEGEFFGTRADVGFGLDAVNLGLDAAVTIAGGAGTKTILGAIATAVHGSGNSIDKHFFREKTSESIIATMRADRLRLENEITKKLLLEDDKYRFEEAWGDLIDYYYAGTVHSALVSIAAAAGKEAKEGEEEKEELANMRAAEVLSELQGAAGLVEGRESVMNLLESTSESVRLNVAGRLGGGSFRDPGLATDDLKARIMICDSQSDLDDIKREILRARDRE